MARDITMHRRTPISAGLLTALFFASVCLAIGLFFWITIRSSESTSGQALTENFFAHRDECAELLEMYAQDMQSERVLNDRTHNSSLDLKFVSGSPERYRQYKAMMRKLHVTAIYGHYGRDGCDVHFKFWSFGLGVLGGRRAIVYLCEAPPSDRITQDIDSYSGRDGRFYYLPLEGNWYLEGTYS